MGVEKPATVGRNYGWKYQGVYHVGTGACFIHEKTVRRVTAHTAVLGPGLAAPLQTWCLNRERQESWGAPPSSWCKNQASARWSPGSGRLHAEGLQPKLPGQQWACRSGLEEHALSWELWGVHKGRAWETWSQRLEHQEGESKTGTSCKGNESWRRFLFGQFLSALWGRLWAERICQVPWRTSAQSAARPSSLLLGRVSQAHFLWWQEMQTLRGKWSVLMRQCRHQVGWSVLALKPWRWHHQDTKLPLISEATQMIYSTSFISTEKLCSMWTHWYMYLCAPRTYIKYTHRPHTWHPVACF